jgi:hypothetical protein
MRRVIHRLHFLKEISLHSIQNSSGETDTVLEGAQR